MARDEQHGIGAGCGAPVGNREEGALMRDTMRGIFRDCCGNWPAACCGVARVLRPSPFDKLPPRPKKRFSGLSACTVLAVAGLASPHPSLSMPSPARPWAAPTFTRGRGGVSRAPCKPCQMGVRALCARKGEDAQIIFPLAFGKVAAQARLRILAVLVAGAGR